MNKTDALENIKETWEDSELELGEKILRISNDFSEAGLDLGATAAYIHTTESELSAFLQLGEFDDEIIEKISKVNPPTTTWTILASASDEEIEHALDALQKGNTVSNLDDEYVYNTMIEVSGPSIEKKILNLNSDMIKTACKKGTDFHLLSESERKFMTSVAGQEKRGKVLSEKQINWLISILNKLIDNGAIVHNSIDGDQKTCDAILECMER